MVGPVIWSAESLQDIEGLAEYISLDSVHHAQRLVGAIMAAGHSLSAMPLRGRVVPEIDDPAIRELFVYSYRLIYAFKDHQTRILAVTHGRRLLSPDERFREA